MPKQNQFKKKYSKVASESASSSSSPSHDQSSHEDKSKGKSGKGSDKSNKYYKPKVELLSHSGITSTSVHSWCHSMSSPEVLGNLDLKLTWSSSLLKEGVDESKVKRPPLVGDEPVKPIPSSDGTTDYFQEKRYWKQPEKADSRTGEERLVYDFTQSKQSPQSLEVCKQDASYDEVNRKQDVVEYLKLTYKTHLVSVSSPIQASLSGLKKFVSFRQLDSQSSVEYFEALRKVMEQVKQSLPADMISEELEAWTLLVGMSSSHSQLKQTLMSSPSVTPKTTKEVKDKVVKHTPLETVSIKSKSQSAYGIKGSKSSSSDSKEKEGKSKGGVEPPRDCDHCLKHHPDFPSKRHWKSACPSIEKLTSERYGHNTQSETSDSTISSQSRSSQSQSNSSSSGGKGAQSSSVTTGLGLSSKSGASSLHIMASIGHLESYKSSYNSHKDMQVLDPQSQVAILNREDLVESIRDSTMSLTLQGVGSGSLVVNQVADHPVLGQVWFHPDASVSVWQVRATEYACSVELTKSYDKGLGCKVTTALLATSRSTGAQYRFNFDSNLYVLEEAGRH